MILNTNKEESVSSLRKAAMLLVVLGEQASAELLQQLSEEDVQKVSREVAKITAISAEQAEGVLTEFHHISTAGDYVARELDASRRPIPASLPSSSIASTRRPSPWCSRISTRRRPQRC